LEIGTLAGYSAITMARALPQNGKLLTIETNPYNAKYAKERFKESDVSEKIEVINANAIDFLKDYKTESKFDFIFLDADKENYKEYTKLLLPLLKDEGTLAADNSFAFGLINEKDDSKIESESIYKIREFNKFFIEHPNFFPVTIVPVGDGMIMGIKKSRI
jgi:caffeoyl-CoA O-methyltransferase